MKTKPEIDGSRNRKTALDGWRRQARALWPVLVVLAAAGLWRAAVAVSRVGAQRMGRELASVDLLVKYPSPNWAGTQALIAQSTKEGVGLTLVDFASGSRRRVYETHEGRILSGSLLLLEWSPDDSACCYAKPIKGKRQSLVFCGASTGATVGSLIVTGYVKEFKWLSPGSLAYLNDRREVCLATRNSRGKWSHAARFEAGKGPAPTHLCAVSPTQAAWKQAGALWTGDTRSEAARVLWRPETNRLVSCYSSPESEFLLVSAENADGSYTALAVRPGNGEAYGQGIIPPGAISKLNWADSGRGLAWQRTDHWGDSLQVWRRGVKGPETLFPEGEVIDFKARGGRLFLYGSRGSEPPGLWEHDLATGGERCLVPASAGALTGLAAVRHDWGMLTNDGRVLAYQRWYPRAGRARVRRPVILSQTPFRWSPYPYAAALAGYEFASINRKSWEEGLENWIGDVLALREELLRQGIGDPARMYLYGHSAETSPISELGAQRPELWRGALLLSPSGLPPLPACRFRSLFLDAGELDPGARQRLERFQNEAARAGVATRLVVHPGARHTSWSRDTEREKVRQLTDWLRAQ